MTEIPRLSTSRLILRPFAMADAGDVQRMMAEKEVAAGALHIPRSFGIKSVTTWIAGHGAQYHLQQSLTLAIEEKVLGLMGAISLYFNAEYNNAELGYWLGKAYWHKGYASEAVEELLRFGFLELKLHRIYANYLEHNIASGKVLERHGMQLEGVLREQVRTNDSYVNLAYRGILREEYLRHLAP